MFEGELPVLMDVWPFLMENYFPLCAEASSPQRLDLLFSGPLM